jgi:hypothetical protein
VLLEEGLIVYSAFFKREVFVDRYLFVLPCDNAMASWFTNHLGSRAISYCRLCTAQVETCCTLGIPKNHLANLQTLFSPATTDEDLKQKGLKLQNYILWDGVDPIQDTPIDTLHTIYLGIVKHFLTDIIPSYSAEQKAAMNAFYYSQSSIKGRNHLNAGNIAKYHKSFQAG